MGFFFWTISLSNSLVKKKKLFPDILNLSLGMAHEFAFGLTYGVEILVSEIFSLSYSLWQWIRMLQLPLV
jgi:hypothetical protein